MNRRAIWIVVGLVTLGVLATVSLTWRTATSEPATSSEPNGPGTDPAGTVGVAADPVQGFAAFARTTPDPATESDAEYVAVGLRTLAGALDCLGLDAGDLPVDLRVGAAHVLIQPESLDTAALVQALTRRASEAITTAASDTALRARAQAISPDRPVGDQRPVFRAYFETASTLLDVLGQRRNGSSTHPCGA